MGNAPDGLLQRTAQLLGCSHAGEAKPVVDALVARLAELTGVELSAEKRKQRSHGNQQVRLAV